MNRLGYFIGGMLAGIIGTGVAAYAVDACSSSSTGASDDLDSDDPASMMENSDSVNVEEAANTNNEAPCTA